MSLESQGCVLVATGAYVPDQEVPNDVLRERFAELGDFVDTMEAKTGITTRWYARADQVTSDLAAEAGRRALARAGLEPRDIDMILVGTDTPDYVTPATSVVVQHKLGAVGAGTFDIGCACASFPTGVATAAGLIATNPNMRRVLVIGAYLMQRLADHQDPTIFFYGDGAAAAVFEASSERGYLGSAFYADGSYAQHWGIFAGAVAEPASVEAVAAGRTQVRVVKRYPSEVNERGWVELFERLAAEQGFAPADVALTIFTQVNRSVIEKVADTLNLPLDRVQLSMGRWGYTGSACIPLALNDALEAGRVGPGDLVVLIGSGVGYNQAGVAIRLTDRLVR